MCHQTCHRHHRNERTLSRRHLHHPAARAACNYALLHHVDYATRRHVIWVYAIVAMPTPSSNYSEPDVFKQWFFLIPKTFAIIHLNIQGLIEQTTRKALGVCDTHSKIDYLRCSVRDDTDPDVICLTETKLSDKINSSEIALPGYNVIRHDRNRLGGDVAIYWRSSLRAHALDP